MNIFLDMIFFIQNIPRMLASVIFALMDATILEMFVCYYTHTPNISHFNVGVGAGSIAYLNINTLFQ